MNFDRAEGTHKIQSYLSLHIFEGFDMRMDDLWSAFAQSQALDCLQALNLRVTLSENTVHFSTTAS